MVNYPAGPFPPVGDPVASFGGPLPFTTKQINGKKFKLRMYPGEGINAAPFEAEGLIDLTYEMGGGSGIMLGLLFQLGKWGYDTFKVSTSVEVSPVFTEYYQRTMDIKRQLEEQIKNGFASLTNAITDFELLSHDVRKYKEYLNYFAKIDEARRDLEKVEKKLGKKMIEEIRSGKVENRDLDDADRKLREALHVLRAVFVDYVDAHAGEGIAMRTIAPRWPTIISDFMELKDDETEEKKIVDRLDISRAEAVILVTKNKLFLEWRDRIFLPTIKERYERLKMMMEARKRSILEYRNQVKPLISRYRAIKEMREGGASWMERLHFFRPDSQAVSLDNTVVWSWRPFIVPELFKHSKETYEKLTFKEAGFYKLVDLYGKEEDRKRMLDAVKKLEKEKRNEVPALPMSPMIDDPLLTIIAQIQDEYEVLPLEQVPSVVYNTIETFSLRFGTPERPTGIKPGIKWPFSPYFVFIYMDLVRTVIRLPNGGMFEDMWFEPLKTFNCTQNIILGRQIELWAMAKKEERDVAMMGGEQIDAEAKIMSIEDSIKSEFPEFFAKDEEQKGLLEKKFKKEENKEISSLDKLRGELNKFRRDFLDFMNKLGIEVVFAYPGPYEKLMNERMSKMMQLGPGRMYGVVSDYLKKGSGVPGAEVKAWI